MGRAPLAMFGMGIALLACGGQPEAVPFRYTAVLTHLAATEDSAVGRIMAAIPSPNDPELTQLDTTNAAFARFAACPRASQPILIDASGTLVGSSGRGQLRMLFVQDADDGTTDHCAGEGRFLVQASSVDEGGEALTRASVVVEGPTLVARLDLTAIFRLELLPFDDRVEVSARLEGDPPALSGGVLTPAWSIASLRGLPVEGTDASYLDIFVLYGGQPDIDRDGDGLEEMEDEDGDGLIDVCRDGDGTELDGATCADDPRIADAFQLGLEYRTAPAQIVGITDP